MNRKEEYLLLKNELNHTPIALEYATYKAIDRAKQNKGIPRFIKAPLLSLCSAAAAFILMINLFPSIALAVSDLPFMEEFVAAVSFNSSLKTAVENDYYQMVDYSQTKEDVTVTIKSMIVDAGHISVFYRIDAPVPTGRFHFEITDENQQPIEAAISYTTYYQSRALEEIKLDFFDSPIPKELNIQLTVNVDENFKYPGEDLSPSEASDPFTIPKEPALQGKDYLFVLNLKPDDTYTRIVDSVLIDKTITIEGQQIYFEKLAIYPTQSRLYFEYVEGNTAIIEKLDITFADDKGNLYGTSKGGISGTGSGTDLKQSLFYESSFFADAKHLTLSIQGITMIKKEELYGEVRYDDKTITNLPEGVTVDAMEMRENDLYLTLRTVVRTDEVGELISSNYYDINSKEYHFKSLSASSTTEEGETIYQLYYVIPDFIDHHFLLQWNYSAMRALTAPIEIQVN
jgi:hypothetical protein